MLSRATIAGSAVNNILLGAGKRGGRPGRSSLSVGEEGAPPKQRMGRRQSTERGADQAAKRRSSARGGAQSTAPEEPEKYRRGSVTGIEFPVPLPSQTHAMQRAAEAAAATATESSSQRPFPLPVLQRGGSCLAASTPRSTHGVVEHPKPAPAWDHAAAHHGAPLPKAAPHASALPAVPPSRLPAQCAREAEQHCWERQGREQHGREQHPAAPPPVSIPNRRVASSGDSRIQTPHPILPPAELSASPSAATPSQHPSNRRASAPPPPAAQQGVYIDPRRGKYRLPKGSKAPVKRGTATATWTSA